MALISGKARERSMSENKRDYAVGRGKPPVHSRFKKGQSGNPRGPRPKNLPALLVEALNEPVAVTIDGERREITGQGFAQFRPRPHWIEIKGSTPVTVMRCEYRSSRVALGRSPRLWQGLSNLPDPA